MSDYSYPYKDAEFLINEIIGFDEFCQSAGLDEVNSELVSAIFEEANRFSTEVIVPLNVIGDQNGATLGEDGVQQTEGFTEAYRQYVDNGWAGLAFPEEYGGQGMPKLVGTAVDEIWQSSNLAFSLCSLLTHGAVELLIKHGSEELRNAYVTNMVSGEWAGSMNLTESSAGSDLAAVVTRAVPEGDHFLITGQKIFISWGDHQMTDNVIHLVLARLPDAPAGSRGISLFLVPKFLLDEQGNPGERNDVHCVSLEHKLGIHASPTCVMAFGDEGGAVGYLVGEQNRGLVAMFTMMNDARQGVGLEGLSLSTRSYQQALQYAQERLQGTHSDGSRFPIIEFPDVRRMLMTMKAATEAMRGLAYIASAEIDLARYSSDPEKAARHSSRIDLYTPIVKGWMSELAQEITSLGIQVYGGMGYVEESGIAQHYRDARILTIYEGTTGIQGQDLVGRKILANNGEHLDDLLAEIQLTVDELNASTELSGLAPALQNAVDNGRTASQWLLDNAGNDRNVAGAVSVNFMMMLGYLCGAWVMGRSAVKAEQLLSTSGDDAFLEAKLVTTRFYFEHLLPRADSCFRTILSGSESMMALAVEQF